MEFLRLLYRFCTLLAVLAMSACAELPVPVVIEMPAAPWAAVAGTEWVAFAVDGVDEVLAPKPKMRWTSAESLSGTGGCNGFSGQVKQVNEYLRIGPLRPSGKPCLTMPGAQEDLFFKAIELTRKGRLEHGQLVFTDETGKMLARFIKAD